MKRLKKIKMKPKVSSNLAGFIALILVPDADAQKSLHYKMAETKAADPPAENSFTPDTEQAGLSKCQLSIPLLSVTR